MTATEATGAPRPQIPLLLSAVFFSYLAQTTLMSDGARVYLCTSNDEVIDLVSRGQGVFGIAVGKVLLEVESSLVELDSVKGEDPADELAARRATRAS